MQKVAHKFEGKTFFRLRVIKRLENHVTKGGTVFSKWLCLCDCGKEVSVIGIDLKSGKTRSCGCLHDETVQQTGLKNKKHGGYSGSSDINYLVRYRALQGIKYRVKKRGYETDLELEDLPSLSDFCPILGLRYDKLGTRRDFAPSVDRRNPNLPYLKKYKDNLCFISFRANRWKNNATIEDLQKIIDYMKMGDEKFSLIDSNPSQTAGNEAQA